MKRFSSISNWFVAKHLARAQNDFEQAKVLMVFRLSFYFMIAYIIYVLALSPFPKAHEFRDNFLFEVFFSLVILGILKYSRSYKPAAIAFTVYNFTILVIYIHMVGDIVTADMVLWFTLLTLYANFTLGRKWGIGTLITIISVLVGFTVYGHYSNAFFDDSFYPTAGVLVVRLINQIITLVFIYYIIREYFSIYNRESIISKKRGESLDIAIEGADLALWDWFIDENQVVFSSKITHLLGYEAKDLESRHEFWEGLIHPEDYARSRQVLHDYLEGKVESYENEYRVQSIFGEWKWLLLRGKIMEREATTGKPLRLSGTYLDISARKEAEIALVRARDEAEKARKIAEEASKAKTQFLSTMSHEIRTPLNGIVGATNLLMEEKPRPDQEENLNILHFSSVHLQSLVNDILDFSKIDAGRVEFEKREFVLSDLTSNIAQALRFKARKQKVNLHLQEDSNLPYLLVGDTTRLNQILLNLVDNAVKFTDAGTVQLKIIRERETANEVRLRFKVIDTGIGIDKDKIPTLFESFKQLNTDNTRKYGGSGLGLAISKRLIELQGGNIEVESEAGKGSTFSFALTFGIGKVVAAASEETAAAKEAKSLKGLRILIVEDNLVNQRLAGKFLTNWGAETDAAEDGEVALEKVRKNHYDLILMDLQMPVMDGFEATQHIRNLADPQKARTPIIALTASALLEVRSQVSEAGMDDFSCKPFNPNELYEKIRNAVQARQQAEKPTSQSLAGWRVLIVEDNLINQRIAHKFILKWQAEADLADNGQIAVEKVRENEYDLILMDLQMPVLDGFEATREIRDMADPVKANIPIIALTASALLEVKDQVRAAGMDDFSSKPFNPDELYQKILNARNKKTILA